MIVNEHVLSLEQTRRHIEVLGRSFDFIHLSDLENRIHERNNKPFCLLTFDDGKRSNATVVDLELNRLGVPYFRSGFLYVVHNKYLLIWTETGVGGLFAYLALLFAGAGMGWECWKQNDGNLSMLALGITAATIGHIVHMNFDVFRIGPVQELLWLLAGLLVPMYRIGGGVTAGRPS